MLAVFDPIVFFQVFRNRFLITFYIILLGIKVRLTGLQIIFLPSKSLWKLGEMLDDGKNTYILPVFQKDNSQWLCNDLC